MNNKISSGVWPVMITPFTDSDKIDYAVLEEMIEWYLERGVDGLFAVCKSSEMYFLTLEERLELARFVRQRVAGRVPVVASGNICRTP
ncbi:MAG: dihydrodipicolinate synthase family protein, partial [Gemmatimonadota bacterium]|nr:dihydrodipicolinate synthase family protein [Gemmatimonadota bacterium]